MELRHIKELMVAMRRNKARKVSVKTDAYTVEIELEGDSSGSGYNASNYALSDSGALPVDVAVHAHHTHSTLARHANINTMAPEFAHKREEAHPSEKKHEEAVHGVYVTSPIVGTFYASASPEDAAFVKNGDKVSENSVVCIVEAMKVMNEVKSGFKGTVVEVLVENGQPVEFGTKLFRILN